MRAPIFDDLKKLKVTRVGPHTICIKEARRHVYLTFDELASIATAARQHLEPAAEIPDEWDPLGQGGGG